MLTMHNLVLILLLYDKYANLFAGGSVVLTSSSITISEGNSSNLCVQLMDEVGMPVTTLLEDDLIVTLSVTLNGNTGIIHLPNAAVK